MNRGLAAASAPPAGAAASNLTRTAALAAGITGVLLAVVRFGFTTDTLVTAALLGTLGALAAIDLRRKVVPTMVALPGAALVLALQLAVFPEQAAEWLIAAFVTFGVLLAISVLRSDSIEPSDALVGLLIGAGLGVDVAAAMLVGLVALWPVAAYFVFSEGVDARKKPIPLTPALALGAAIVALAG